MSTSQELLRVRGMSVLCVDARDVLNGGGGGGGEAMGEPACRADAGLVGCRRVAVVCGVEHCFTRLAWSRLVSCELVSQGVTREQKERVGRAAAGEERKRREGREGMSGGDNEAAALAFARL